MAQQLSGVPKALANVVDASLVFNKNSISNICVQGVTKRGKIGVPVFVRNSTEFRREFGGDVVGNDFALHCRRILDGGGKLWVSRVGHYTDVADRTTLVGTKGTAVLGVTLNLIAEEVGDGYNGTVVQTVTSSSGLSTTVDIKVTAKDSDTTQTYKDFPKTALQADIDAFNAKSKYVKIVSTSGPVIVGSASITGGIQAIASIVATDYNGSSVGKTGWWSFGKVTDAMRIANIAISDPVVDLGLASYAINRGDMRFHIASPINATPTTCKDYRMGTGVYSHQPINDWRGSLFAGQVNITSENDSTKKFNIPALVDYLALRSKVDTEFGPWITATGPQRGLVTMPNNGVDEVNFMSPENSDVADEAFTAGVNAIVDDETYGTVAWGNKSLLLDRSKLLNAENIADLAMFIKRSIEPIAKKFIAEPNTPSTWKRLYREVLPFIKTLEEGRGIVAGEGIGWFWIGDQEVDLAINAEFNTQEDLGAGIYKVRFVFIPIRAIDFIGIDVTITDSNSVVSVVENVL